MLHHGVNVVFSGHVHTYERSHPIGENRTVVAAGHGIVHVTTGTAGASLHQTANEKPYWSALRAAYHGHVEFRVTNATHALLEVGVPVGGECRVVHLQSVPLGPLCSGIDTINPPRTRQTSTGS